MQSINGHLLNTFQIKKNVLPTNTWKNVQYPESSWKCKSTSIRNTLRFHLTPVRMAIMKKTTTNAGEDAGTKEFYSLLVMIIN
jgi:hypothetical protein